jgi:hypothetical protein
LVGMIKQRLLFVLAVDVQQERRELAQNRDRRRLIVDVNPISLVRRDFTADDDFVRFGVKSEPLKFSAQIELEVRFNDRPAFAGADHFRRGLGSRKQAERVDDDGFSGSGLAGKEVKAFFEMKFQMIDESEISNANKSQHTRGVISHRGLIFQCRRINFLF